MIMLTDAPLLFTPGQVNCLLWLTFCSNFRVLSFLEHLLTLNILVDVFSWHWQRCTSQITCMEFLILRGHCPYAHYLSLSLSLSTFSLFLLSLFLLSGTLLSHYIFLMFFLFVSLFLPSAPSLSCSLSCMSSLSLCFFIPFLSTPRLFNLSLLLSSSSTEGVVEEN